MRDEQLFIGCQALAKELIQLKLQPDEAEKQFNFWMDLIEKRATLPEDEEWVNMEIPITREYWNLTPQNQTKWITEWGRPMPVINKIGKKEWYLFVQRKNMAKFKETMSEFNQSVSKETK